MTDEEIDAEFARRQNDGMLKAIGVRYTQGPVAAAGVLATAQRETADWMLEVGKLTEAQHAEILADITRYHDAYIASLEDDEPSLSDGVPRDDV